MSIENIDSSLYYFCKLTKISPQELALAMSGFDYDTDKTELGDIKFKEVIRLRSAITRNIQMISEHNSVSPTQLIESNIVLTAAYIFQNDEIIPVQVKERIESALQQQVKKKEWADILMKLGGNELYETGKTLRSNGRGQYRKEDEDNNSCKLISLLIELLKKHGKASYIDNSVIYNDIKSLCDERHIKLDGIKRATFYAKLKMGAARMKYGE